MNSDLCKPNRWLRKSLVDLRSRELLRRKIISMCSLIREATFRIRFRRSVNGLCWRTCSWMCRLECRNRLGINLNFGERITICRTLSRDNTDILITETVNSRIINRLCLWSILSYYGRMVNYHFRLTIGGLRQQCRTLRFLAKSYLINKRRLLNEAPLLWNFKRTAPNR